MKRQKLLRSNVGALVTRRRKELGWKSSKTFCADPNNPLDESTYACIEAGYDFKFSTLMKVCKELKITPQELLKDLINY